MSSCNQRYALPARVNLQFQRRGRAEQGQSAKYLVVACSLLRSYFLLFPPFYIAHLHTFMFVLRPLLEER
jgi:hypothetical protein